MWTTRHQYILYWEGTAADGLAALIAVLCLLGTVTNELVDAKIFLHLVFTLLMQQSPMYFCIGLVQQLMHYTSSIIQAAK